MAPPPPPHGHSNHELHHSYRFDGPANSVAPAGHDSSSAPSVSPTMEAGVVRERAEPPSHSAAATAGAGASRGSRKRPAARGASYYPRQRGVKACQVCRARKTKCDSKKPSCSYCVSVGAVCIQSSFDLSSFDPASLKILDRLDDLERLLRASASLPEASAVVAYGVAAPSFVVNDGGPVIGQLSQHRQVGLQPYDDDSRLSSSSGYPHSSSGAKGDGPLVSSVLPQRIADILQWPVWNQQQAWPAADWPLDDAIASPGATLSLADIDMDMHRIPRLVDSFFLNIHVKNPILDEPSARRTVMRAFLDGIDWSGASCLALLVCALGCIASPFGPSPETRLGTQAYADSQVFFAAAQKRIGILLVQSDKMGATCLFLSGVYMMSTFQPVYAWRFFSQSLAACQSFPFLARCQQDPSLSGTETGRHETQEQAVYWSAWKSERELRGELHLPDFDNGQILEYPPFFPAPPVHSATSSDGPDSEPQRSRASWLFYLAEISLRRLTSRLCSEILALRRRYACDATFLDVLADMTREYEAQAREWSDSLPTDFSMRTPIDDDGICRSVLRGRLINLYEMIYWPFVMAALSHSQHRLQRPLKPALADLARKGLDTHMLQVRANEPGFHHRHHGAFFMIRACTRSALALAAVAKAGCAEVYPPSGWREAVGKVVGMLSYWEGEDRSLSEWKATLERELAAEPDER